MKGLRRGSVCGARRGHLLIEQLVTLALAAIMLTAALSSWSAWRSSAQARQWAQQMQISLDQLRRQAMQQERELSLCGSRDGRQCDLAATGIWLVFADGNGDGLRQPSEPGWRGYPAVLPGWRAIWRSFRNQPRMIWLASGDAATANGTLTLCPPTAHDAALRQLVISKSGRVRLVQPSQAGAATLKSARAVCGWA